MIVEMAPSVRLAAASEADEIALLVQRALAEYRVASPVVHEGYVAYSLDHDHAAGADQIVAELNGRIVGSVLFHARVRGRPGWPRHAATFQTLAVDPEVRRQGIGGLLVEACLERAREGGAREVVIETLPVMASAEAFYRPFGFVRWPDGDWDGTRVLSAILVGRDVPRTVLSAWRLKLGMRPSSNGEQRGASS